MTRILGIETSCDETAAAVVEDGLTILSNVVASQSDLHARFGGVVPEIASRSHQEVLCTVIEQALAEADVTLREVDAIAVTQGPGLPGALMIGFATAKGLAFASGLPLIGINHLEAHLFANRLEHPELRPPFVALIVSGGHTLLAHVTDWGSYRVLGETLDDAAGEAFDKIAGFLGLGYPGGPAVARMAREGDPHAIEFPRAMLHSKDYNFSLSGLKTAVLTHVNRARSQGDEPSAADVCAAFQAAVVEVQVAKTARAAQETGVDLVVLAGGVAANNELREQLAQKLTGIGVDLKYPSIDMCTDNAAMVAAAGFHRYLADQFLVEDVESIPSMKL